MSKANLSNREFEILELFWNHKSSFTAKQLHEINSNLSLSTIQNVLQKLVKKNLLKVDIIVYSGKVLTRKYISCISREDYILNQYEHIEMGNLLAGFLGKQSRGNSSSEIEKIEKLLDNERKKLQGK